MNRAERRRQAALARKGQATEAVVTAAAQLAAYDEAVRRSGLGYEQFLQFVTSIHEAGHAVVARGLMLGVEFCEIREQLDPDRGIPLAGYTALVPPDIDGMSFEEKAMCGRKFLAHALAGEEAEKRAGIYVAPDELDQLNLEQMLAGLKDSAGNDASEDDRARYRNAARQIAAECTRRLWPCILAVAAELRERGRLTGDEIDDICDRAFSTDKVESD